MAEQAIDVKTTDASSASAAKETAGNVSTSQSTTSKTDVKEESMADIVAKVADKHSIDMSGKSPGTKEEGDADGSVQNLNETKEKEEKSSEENEQITREEKVETKDEGKETDKVEVDDGKSPPETIPYKRFKEVNDKAKDFENRFLSAEPVVKAHEQIVAYCKANHIEGQQFQDGLQLLSLINQKPQEAVKLLSSMIEQIQGFTGDRLPEDLQKEAQDAKVELDNGEISQSRYDAYIARIKELAQTRATTKMTQQQQERSRQSQVQEQESQWLRSLTTTAKSWEEAKSKSDPNFRPGSEIYDLMYDRFNTLARKTDGQGKPVNPLNSPEDVNKLLQTSYEQITSLFSKAKKQSKQANGKILTSTGSSVSADVEPKSMTDLARIVGAKHGITI